MSKERKVIYQDSHKPAFNPRTVTRVDLVIRELCQFQEEIAKRLKGILQDLFNQYDELKGLENRERRMTISRDIREHTKLYKDLVAIVEITAEKNEIRKADRRADRLLTDRGYLALPDCCDRFVHGVERAIKNLPIPWEGEMRKELHNQIDQIFEESFHIFLLNLAVEDKEREDFNEVPN